MNEQIIYWNKKYYEDLGEKDDEGFYDYVYRYFDFWFNLPEKQAIRARIYTDETSKCNLHGIYIQQNSYGIGKEWDIIKKLDEDFVSSNIYFISILNFLRESEKVKNFFYIDKKYKKINYRKIDTSSVKFVKTKGLVI